MYVCAYGTLRVLTRTRTPMDSTRYVKYPQAHAASLESSTVREMQTAVTAKHEHVHDICRLYEVLNS